MTHAERLARVHGLYGIVDDDPLFTIAPLAWALALDAGGASAIQLRFKRTPMGAALAIARAVRAALPRTLLIIDDRPDLALLCNADGVHVGDHDLPVGATRALLGAERLVGATARTAQAAREHLAEGADHLGVGPVFATQTKVVDHPPMGTAGLRAVCEALDAPVVAIAGITLENIAQVAAAGAHAAAVVSAVGRASDPASAATALATAFARGGR